MGKGSVILKGGRVFSLSAPEAAFILLYVAGMVSALYVFFSARGVRSAVVLLCAFSLPILGSVTAVALAAGRLRTRYADLRSGEGDA